jgi:hypothetical protein
MLRNKIAFALLAVAAAAITACSSPTAPTQPKQACGVQAGGEVCK